MTENRNVIYIDKSGGGCAHLFLPMPDGKYAELLAHMRNVSVQNAYEPPYAPTIILTIEGYRVVDEIKAPGCTVTDETPKQSTDELYEEWEHTVF